jgi:hypothetical protein
MLNLSQQILMTFAMSAAMEDYLAKEKSLANINKLKKS